MILPSLHSLFLLSYRIIYTSVFYVLIVLQLFYIYLFDCHWSQVWNKHHCHVATDSTSYSSCEIKGKGKGQVLDIELLHDEHMLRSGLQSRKWQLIGMSIMRPSIARAIAINWTHGAACRRATASIINAIIFLKHPKLLCHNVTVFLSCDMHIAQSIVSIHLWPLAWDRCVFHTFDISPDFVFQVDDAWSASIPLFIRNPVQCLFCSSGVVHALHLTKTTWSSFLDCVLQHILSVVSLVVLALTLTFQLSKLQISTVLRQLCMVESVQAFPVYFCYRPRRFCTIVTSTIDLHSWMFGYINR